MKKLLFFTFVIITFATATSTANDKEKKEITGQWKYEVPNAPYGYQKGTIFISQEKGNLVGYAKLEDGGKIEFQKISYTKKILTAALYVESEYISIKAKINNKKMEGTVDSSQGKIELTAHKKE